MQTERQSPSTPEGGRPRRSDSRGPHGPNPRSSTPADDRHSPAWPHCSRQADRRTSDSARRRYPSDLTDQQWMSIEHFLTQGASRTVPRRRSLRDIADAVNYRWVTGCAWRMLPHDFPPWTTVYTHFRRWQRLGTLTAIRAVLLSRRRVRYAPASTITVPQASILNPQPLTINHPAAPPASPPPSPPR